MAHEEPPDLYTEEQLPRGTMLVVGRTLTGKELAGVLKLNEMEHNNRMIKWLESIILGKEVARDYPAPGASVPYDLSKDPTTAGGNGGY